MWDGLLPLAQSHQVWGYVISFWYLLLHLNIYIFTQKLFSFISQLNSFIYHLKIKVPKSFQMICSFHLHRLYNILKKINKTTFSFFFNLSWLKYIIARGIWIFLIFWLLNQPLLNKANKNHNRIFKDDKVQPPALETLSISTKCSKQAKITAYNT